MEKKKKTALHSRRYFLTLAALAAGSKMVGQSSSREEKSDPETVKMLTPDGKLVEVQKSVLDRATNRQKATNRDLLTWRDSPEKGKSS